MGDYVDGSFLGMEWSGRLCLFGTADGLASCSSTKFMSSDAYGGRLFEE